MYAMKDVFLQEISLTNTIQDTETAINYFKDFAKSYEIPAVVTTKINIMLNELISNILNYGFLKEQKVEITIRLELSAAGKLSIKLKHKGIPFNPFHLSPPNLTVPLEEREIGGFGIHLVRKLMDEYSYQRDLDCNVVSLSKNQL